MAGETNTDKIVKLLTLTEKLEERIDHHTRELARVEAGLQQILNRLEASTTENLTSRHLLDKDLALCVRDVTRVERRFDELLARRWDLWKLILAAFLGSLLTVATGIASKSIETLIVPGARQRPPAVSSSPVCP
jgi:hypothetical protein